MGEDGEGRLPVGERGFCVHEMAFHVCTTANGLRLVSIALSCTAPRAFPGMMLRTCGQGGHTRNRSSGLWPQGDRGRLRHPLLLPP